MSSLASLGKAGLWQVDIDNEEDADHGYPWSVTLTHTSCYVQWGVSSLELLDELVCHLTNPKSVDQLFHLSHSNGAELLIGVVQERLLLRVDQSSQIMSKPCQWMMEVSLLAEEVNTLTIAIRDALRDTELS
jgi:hypothetical protein